MINLFVPDNTELQELFYWVQRKEVGLGLCIYLLCVPQPSQLLCISLPTSSCFPFLSFLNQTEKHLHTPLPSRQFLPSKSLGQKGIKVMNENRLKWVLVWMGIRMEAKWMEREQRGHHPQDLRQVEGEVLPREERSVLGSRRNPVRAC